MNTEDPNQPAAPAQPVEAPVQRMIREAEEFARREPTKALAAAFGAGFLLNVLPTRFIVGTVTAVAVPFMRPALLALGLIKAAEMCCAEPKNEQPRDGVY